MGRAAHPKIHSRRCMPCSLRNVFLLTPTLHQLYTQAYADSQAYTQAYTDLTHKLTPTYASAQTDTLICIRSLFSHYPLLLLVLLRVSCSACWAVVHPGIMSPMHEYLQDLEGWILRCLAWVALMQIAVPNVQNLGTAMKTHKNAKVVLASLGFGDCFVSQLVMRS